MITDKRHKEIVDDYKYKMGKMITQLAEARDLKNILDRLTDKFDLIASPRSCVLSVGVMNCLDDTIPRYVEDYFGGRVIKQESTPITILDEKGIATYGMTKKPADKGRKYLLIQE